MKVTFSLCLFLQLILIGHGAKILALLPFGSYSHFTLGFRILKELSEKGHELTVVSYFPQQNPLKNYRDISIADATPLVKDFMKDLFGRSENFFSKIAGVYDMGHFMTKTLLEHEKVKDLLSSNQKFDLIFMEHFLDDALIGLGHHFDCPVVLLAPMPAINWNNYLVANPAPLSYIPSLLTTFASDMDLWKRLQNVFFDVYDVVYFHSIVLPKQADLLKKTLPNAPPLQEIVYNRTSIILVNSHTSLNDPKPHVPQMIEIGGYHVRPPKELPAEIKKFMDNAKEGVIYFSLGSSFRSSDLTEDVRNAILKSFAKIKQQVLWKFEADLPDKPDNVKIMSWCPQEDILAHPNLRAFISHGGRLSTMETIYHGVPVIGIPMGADQYMNIAEAARQGFAIPLDKNEITEENLSWALNEIINNPRYQENAKKRSELFHDRPLKPLDEAVYWIEYAIRHKGASHLKVAGLKLNWYQRNMVDIIIILSAVTAILFFIFYEIFKHIIHLFTKTKKMKVSKSKKNK